MRFYLANGRYFPTKHEARAASRDFVPVDVPTDKDGLLAYLNDRIAKERTLTRPLEQVTVVPFHKDDIAVLEHMAEAKALVPAMNKGGAIGIVASIAEPETNRIVEIIGASRGYPLARFASAVAVAYHHLGKKGG